VVPPTNIDLLASLDLDKSQMYLEKLMPRNKALILVDVQNDFLPGGALGVPDGHLATPLLWELMEDVDVLVFTRDWHPADHSSFSSDPEYRDGSWPPHCIRGTTGALFDDMTFERGLDTQKPLLVVNKGQVKEKEAYSGFDPRGAVALQFNIDNINLVGSTLSGARLLRQGYCPRRSRLDR
jgi:nicotinamidase/pyrazinamidase